MNQEEKWDEKMRHSLLISAWRFFTPHKPWGNQRGGRRDWCSHRDWGVMDNDALQACEQSWGRTHSRYLSADTCTVPMGKGGSKLWNHRSKQNKHGPCLLWNFHPLSQVHCGVLTPHTAPKDKELQERELLSSHQAHTRLWTSPQPALTCGSHRSFDSWGWIEETFFRN